MRTEPMAALALLCAMACSCAAGGGIHSRIKIKRMERDSVSTTLTLPKGRQYQAPEVKNTHQKDTIKVVDFEGKELFLMKTIVDEDGNSVASQTLDAAVVTARFRHLAERNGKVNLEFQIIVPSGMQDSRWQLRYQPMMYMDKDSVALDRVFITGKEYRRLQYRGYELYRRFLRRIITDSTRLVDIRRLEIFLARNIPEIYNFRNDSSMVWEADFEGLYGVTQREATEHFTRRYLVERNKRLNALKGKKYRQLVRSPIQTEKLRLDTVVQVNGNYVYSYVQELDMKGHKKLKKVDIVLGGEIYQQDNLLYTIPSTSPLTFYISSLSAFVDGTQRYITKVVERKVRATRDYCIDFPTGSNKVDVNFAGNREAIASIKDQLHSLMSSQVFDLDSVIVTSTASPEGSVASNDRLSQRRSQSISAYFNSFIKSVADSIRREEGIRLNLDDTYSDGKGGQRTGVPFLSRYASENWDGLHLLIESDSLLTLTQKEDYYALCEIEDLDEREKRMRAEPWYAYVRDKLYPKLRRVYFNFHLARKGMAKDTVQTTVIDSVYMSGVQAIRDRDYEKAAQILAPYADYNTAIAYSALDRNYNAMAILEKCEKTAEVDYMMAILYSRFADDEKAVQAYMDACAKSSQYIHRGNLDPEISSLISKYNLNNY